MLIHAKNAADTEKLAEYLAGKILSAGPRRNAAVISLVGNLGAGKTHFTKAFMKALGIKETVQSPTFNIMKIYEIPEKVSKDFRSAYHIDAYRIKSEDLLKLGWDNIVKDNKNIVLVEWADIVKDILPADALKIEIEHGEKESNRKIKLS